MMNEEQVLLVVKIKSRAKSDHEQKASCACCENEKQSEER